MTIRQLLISTLFVLLSATSLMAAEQAVQLSGGESIRVFYFEPETGNHPPPLAIFIAGGSNNEFMAKAQFWLGKEFVDRGWAIAVPLSPDGTNFSLRESSNIPQIVAELHASHELQDSKPLLVGMSSGGSEAIALAALNPQSYRGVVATPGRIKDGVALNELNGLPFYIRIGEKDDFRWNRMLEPMARQLSLAGAEVDAELVNDSRHVFQIDWNKLEDWLQKLK